jgi:hypothetical protein
VKKALTQSAASRLGMIPRDAGSGWMMSGSFVNRPSTAKKSAAARSR